MQFCQQYFFAIFIYNISVQYFSCNNCQWQIFFVSLFLFFPRPYRIECLIAKEYTVSLFFRVVRDSNREKLSSNVDQKRKLGNYFFSNLRWELARMWKVGHIQTRGGLGGCGETWQSFITDITDLTDRPSGNPRMDVRDITAITLNMIRYHVILDYIIF